MPYKYVAVKKFVKYSEGFNLLSELKNKYFKNFEFFILYICSTL